MWTKTSLLVPASIQNRKNLRKKTSKSCENRLQKHQKISIKSTFISKKNKTFIGTYCCALVVHTPALYIHLKKKHKNDKDSYHTQKTARRYWDNALFAIQTGRRVAATNSPPLCCTPNDLVSFFAALLSG
ncbi:unnamed protein product [Amoebophrya sp. A120]|nr:unnamed protein product [Amoebophrya sp. A120]|eukprot:GSA120T00023111001.1